MKNHWLQKRANKRRCKRIEFISARDFSSWAFESMEKWIDKYFGQWPDIRGIISANSVKKESDQ
jgi:hypothetical protein